MEEILKEIQLLRTDLNIPQIAYVTMEHHYDMWDFDKLHVYTDPSKIPYLYSEYGEYFTEEDVKKLEINKCLTGNNFRIIKTQIN